jgi:hypothetical protein
MTLRHDFVSFSTRAAVTGAIGSVNLEMLTVAKGEAGTFPRPSRLPHRHPGEGRDLSRLIVGDLPILGRIPAYAWMTTRKDMRSCTHSNGSRQTL